MTESIIDGKLKLKNCIEKIKNIDKNKVKFIFALSGMTHGEYILYLENDFEADIEKLKVYIKENSNKPIWAMNKPIEGIDGDNWLKFERAFKEVAESLGQHYDLEFGIPDPFSPGFSVFGGYKYTFNGLNMYSEMSMNVLDLHMYIFTVEK